MSKLNSRAKDSNSISKTSNLAGGAGYDRIDSKQELVSIVLNFIDDSETYYESRSSIINSLNKSLDKNNPEFIAKLMVFTRETLGLRYVSKLLGNYLLKKASGTNYLTPALYRSFIRPDDITDLFALAGKMTNALRRASRRALENKFDEYQLKKYSCENLNTKLKDIVKLSRPNPKRFENKNIFKDLIEDNLPKIVTAQTINSETKISSPDQRYLNYKDNFDKLGYMAIIKNLFNFLKAGLESKKLDKSDISLLVELIDNPERVKKSKILPYRFIDAIESVDSLNLDSFNKKKILKSLTKALKSSAQNINLGERVALLLDDSGSMGGQPFKFGKALTAALMNDKSVVYLWSSDCKDADYSDTLDFILKQKMRGGGTYIEAPLKRLLETKTVVDTVIVFTDMQLYSNTSYKRTIQSYINKYRTEINPDAKFIFWNLMPYNTISPFKPGTKGIYEVNSVSDKIITLLPKIIDNKSIISEIESINLYK